MKQWQIFIYCGSDQVGPAIPATMWDVLSKLADVRKTVCPLGWHTEAYPVLNREDSHHVLLG